MTTRIRIQHMDSAFEVQVQQWDKQYSPDPNTPPAPDVLSQTTVLAGKGDEVEMYIHDGRRVTVSEVPPKPVA